jgi:hypothetical protein
MRTRIGNKIDICSIIKEDRRRGIVFAKVVWYTQDECDASWDEAKKIVKKNLRDSMLCRLMKN